MSHNAHPDQPAHVPASLVAAALHHLFTVRPPPEAVRDAIIGFALGQDYEPDLARALLERMYATARMRSDPCWPAIKYLADMGGTDERLIYERVTYQFLGTAPLDAAGRFDASDLQRRLLAALPAAGRG